MMDNSNEEVLQYLKKHEKKAIFCSNEKELTDQINSFLREECKEKQKRPLLQRISNLLV